MVNLDGLVSIHSHLELDLGFFELLAGSLVCVGFSGCPCSQWEEGYKLPFGNIVNFLLARNNLVALLRTLNCNLRGRLRKDGKYQLMNL